MSAFNLGWNEPHARLVLREPYELLFERDGSEIKKLAPINGRILRECGAKDFEIISPVPDGGGEATLPITYDNKAVIECVFEKSSEYQVVTGIRFRRFDW